MKSFVEHLSARLSIRNKQLLEKDILLHRILLRLSRDANFFKDFSFKGGTCLSKCYLGYYRFSEDVDFTYIHQDEFVRMSQSALRKLLSRKIDGLGVLLQHIAADLHLRFSPKKSDREYIELGGSNKFVTFKLWYVSAIDKYDRFIKVQISFEDTLLYPLQERKAQSAIEETHVRELTFLFPAFADVFTDPTITCYDLREIMLEKIRALLTRRGVKARDYIDLFLITQKKKLSLHTFRTKILQKARFMLRHEKYVRNLKSLQLEQLSLGEEEHLLLQPLPQGFEAFVGSTQTFLKGLADELK